jgi:hypothetical protein
MVDIDEPDCGDERKREKSFSFDLSARGRLVRGFAALYSLDRELYGDEEGGGSVGSLYLLDSKSPTPVSYPSSN